MPNGAVHCARSGRGSSMARICCDSNKFPWTTRSSQIGSASLPGASTVAGRIGRFATGLRAWRPKPTSRRVYVARAGASSPPSARFGRFGRSPVHIRRIPSVCAAHQVAGSRRSARAASRRPLLARDPGRRMMGHPSAPSKRRLPNQRASGLTRPGQLRETQKPRIEQRLSRNERRLKRESSRSCRSRASPAPALSTSCSFS
jgi:hypothetical protein